MATNRVQRGEIITVTAAAAISSGQIVTVGNLVGVAMTDAAIGEQVEVAISEVYNLPKLDAAVITQGMRVALDVSAGTNGEVDDDAITPAAGDITTFGVAFEAKGATTGETIAVLLTPGTGVVN